MATRWGGSLTMERSARKELLGMGRRGAFGLMGRLHKIDVAKVLHLRQVVDAHRIC